MTSVLVLNGVNLNMLGQRDPELYGTTTLAQVEERVRTVAGELGVEVDFFQTNHEGEMVERIHRAHTDRVDAVVINAGAWTHYSYAIRDALEILSCPFYEVHMSNVHAREPFRAHSVLSDKAAASLVGLGADVYPQALRAAVAAQGTE